MSFNFQEADVSFSVFVCLHHDRCMLSLLFYPEEINPTQNSSWSQVLLVNTFKSDLDKLPLLNVSIEHYLFSLGDITNTHTHTPTDSTCFYWRTLVEIS